ncbi:methyltransferase [Priestia megaterium]|uniref:MgtC/SapB family protein n=1 Tax=Priestia megaterium TaxID=1404 RepID=UPI0006818E88|nr:MgtC/SapB family protein [Priestia megaterium]KNH25835.1 methyltransferase [Priestia megaterium]
MTAAFISRLALSGLLGALVGLEREFRAKEAGFRTHFLVAVGSTLIMLISKYGFSDVLHQEHMALDPSRVAAQVVSGIGFLGAGMIIIQKQHIRGLTTAAGVWATSGIGLTIGAGMYTVGISATILVLIGLEILNVMFTSLSTHSILIKFRAANQEDIYELLDKIERENIMISSYEIHQDHHQGELLYFVEIKGKAKKKGNKVELIKSIHSMAHVLFIEIE